MKKKFAFFLFRFRENMLTEETNLPSDKIRVIFNVGLIIILLYNFCIPKRGICSTITEGI